VVSQGALARVAPTVTDHAERLQQRMCNRVRVRVP
jgi:hypothetical protein